MKPCAASPFRREPFRQRLPGAGLLLSFLAAGMLCPVQPVWSAAPTVQGLVNQFDPVHYQDLLANKLYTRQGMNRAAGVGPELDLCREAIYAELESLGLAPVKDYFTYTDSNGVPRTACNIVAIKPGVQNPSNEIYVVGGHYDSKSNPGADDNGSGIACLLELARIFQPYHFAKTLVFCAFDAEEIYDYYGAHRLGSLRYVDQHRTDNIQGMIAVDMIAWQASGSSSNSAYIEGRPTVAAIRNDLRNAMLSYGEGLQPILRTSSGDLSDHVAFADAGFQACLLIEAYFSSNPNYHKLTDYVERPNYIDWTYAGKMCKTVIGYYATKLEPVDVSPRALACRPGAGGAMVLEFAGLPGCTYVVEVAPDLASRSWVSLQTNIASLADGLFQATDAQAAVRPAGFYRARFAAGYVGATPPQTDIIVDNPSASLVGVWSAGTSSTDKYGSDYRFKAAGTGNACVEFRPNLQRTGNYHVYEWHPQGANRTTDAPVDIGYLGGTNAFRVNQQINGGLWLYLGTFPFAAGTTGYVRIKDNFTTGSVVLADAVRFVYAP